MRQMTATRALRSIVLVAGALCSVKVIGSVTALVFGLYPLAGELGSQETTRSVAYRVLIGYGLIVFVIACASLAGSLMEMRRKKQPSMLNWLCILAIAIFLGTLIYALLPIPGAFSNQVLNQFAHGLRWLPVFGIVGSATPLIVGVYSARLPTA
jgi:hypothetical protein